MVNALVIESKCPMCKNLAKDITHAGFYDC